MPDNKQRRGAKGRGRAPLKATLRAVRRAMEHSFLSDEAQELNRRSFTKTIWRCLTRRRTSRPAAGSRR